MGECTNRYEVGLNKPKFDYIKGGLIYSIRVPCGKCYNCKKNKANAWSFRIMKEVEVSQSAYFVTLTYEQPPLTRKKFMTLSKKHVQDYIKRLRKLEEEDITIAGTQVKKLPIKYYAAGEYGERRKRPHYHLIIMNVKNRLNIYYAWEQGKEYKVYNKKGHKRISINEHQTYIAGNVDIQEVNINTIDYTVKYLNKDQKANLFKAFDGEKEFNIQSKDLGLNYIVKRQNLLHHRENVNQNYLVTKRGYKIPMPKYLRDKVYQCLDPFWTADMTNATRCGVCSACVARDMSIAYIINKHEQNEDKNRLEAERNGKDYDIQKQQIAEQQQKKLKNNPKKRNID